jgi:molybdopterin-binding protein
MMRRPAPDHAYAASVALVPVSNLATTEEKRIMKLSARNQIAGTIKAVKPGATTTHVTIEVSPAVTITASITNEAAEELALKPGIKATAVIKASDVMVGV